MTPARAAPWKAQDWVPAIDALRGLAALIVVIHHALQQLLGNNGGWEITHIFGAWGVTLFFVLSGFCIHLPQARRLSRGDSASPDWRHFFRQRARRLVPAYYVALLLSTGAAFYVETVNLHPPTWKSFASHLFFVHGLTGDLTGINTVFWSIGVEVHFYLVYPLFLAVRRRLGAMWTVVALLILGLAYYFTASVLTPPSSGIRFEAQNFFLATWWQWAMGAALAEIYLAANPPRVFARLFRTPGALPLWFALSFGVVYLKLTVLRLHLNSWMLPVLCALLLGAAITMPLAAQLRFRWLGRMGEWSYSLYLTHPLAIAALLPFTRAWPVPAQLLAFVAAAIALSYAMFELVERRTMKRRASVTVPHLEA
jgi:peptidoglycan/LPS O-acetylase OafA/YrhL